MCENCGSVRGVHIRPSRRSLIHFTVSAIGLAFAGTAFAKEAKAPPKPQNVLAPDAALKRLMEGNARYVEMSKACRGGTISSMSARRWPAARTRSRPC